MTALNGDIGKKYIVQSIKLDEDIERRLETLGLTSGTSFEILGKKRRGSMIIKVRGTRFAIGADIAIGIITSEGDSK
ncbi:MAG: FeoA domain-containing protein [Oscillospiraceae bacterium]|nr:FeoA domain-containing protein [Oscillospiraceae bacterium]